jgi:putative DNA primase/helicase
MPDGCGRRQRVDMTVEQLLERLRGVRKTSRGWESFCPAHDDQAKRSLSIARGRDGRGLVNCFVGCPTEAIVAALHLTLADLFPDTAPARSGRAEIERTYDYVDERGVLLYQVVRFKPKAFRPRRPDGQGGWIWNLEDVPRRVLYRLPALAESPRVYLCEGEKDVDALAAWGLPATTTHGGAAQWRSEYVEQLKALAVEELVAFPDNDEAGAEYVSKASAGCRAAGLRVKIARLAGLAHKGDVSDWIAAGGTREALLRSSTRRRGSRRRGRRRPRRCT